MALCAPVRFDDPLSRLLLLGVSARTVTPELRDRLFGSEPDQARLIAALQGLGCEEGLVLATCERVELLVVARPGQRVAAQLLQLIAAAIGCAPSALAGQSYCHAGEDALRHLLAVTAALESQLIGEPQILGQVKQSYRMAQEAGLAGPYLAAATRAAFAAARRVRRDTPIGQQASSMSQVAVDAARDLFGRFDGLVLLWLGLGEMGEMLSDDFAAAGIGARLVMHPSIARAEATARRLGCNLAPWAELDRHLGDADIVISDAGTGRFTLGREQVAQALQRRRHRPMLLIDAGVPADIEPGAGTLDDAFVYDLDDLERLASRESGGRAAASTQALGILEDELARFLRGQAERPATPAVVALRRHFEAVRRAVLESGEADAAAVTRLLVNRLLHAPSAALRRSAAEDPDRAGALEETIRLLFDLAESADDGDEADQDTEGRREKP